MSRTPSSRIKTSPALATAVFENNQTVPRCSPGVKVKRDVSITIGGVTYRKCFETRNSVKSSREAWFRIKAMEFKLEMIAFFEDPDDGSLSQELNDLLKTITTSTVVPQSLKVGNKNR